MRAAYRAADLAKKMLAYSGKGKFVIISTNLGSLIEEMAPMLQVSVSKKAQLRLNVAPTLPAIDADPGQLQQLIINLVTNASEAIGENSGVITVTTGCIHCSQAYLKQTGLDESLTEGEYACLEVADTGCGMDQETLTKVFEPFFTTKYTGRGLGLAAVQGIVRGHNGAITACSEPGKGTTFTVFLPAGKRPEEKSEAEAEQQAGWQGSGTILLVDDEESVLSATCELLQAMGFSVITAMDGRSAIEKYRENREGITCVILDLTMPQMGGKQCFQELNQVNPAVRVLISSGYSEQEISRQFTDKGISGIIQKPYNLSVLRRKLRAVLETA
jgi:CheY-like chemotaxis protein